MLLSRFPPLIDFSIHKCNISTILIIPIGTSATIYSVRFAKRFLHVAVIHICGQLSPVHYCLQFITDFQPSPGVTCSLALLVLLSKDSNFDNRRFISRTSFSSRLIRSVSCAFALKTTAANRTPVMVIVLIMTSLYCT